MDCIVHEVHKQTQMSDFYFSPHVIPQTEMYVQFDFIK